MKLTTRLATAMVGATALACISLHALSAPTLDSTFGGSGIVVGPPNAPGFTSFVREGVVTDRFAGVLFLRTVSDVATDVTDLVRIKSNGDFDLAFGAGGAAPVAVNSGFLYSGIALDRRRILVAYGTGTSIAYSVLRFSEDGATDAGFGAGGVATIPVIAPNGILDVKAQSDRKVLVVGGTENPAAAPGNQQITLYRLTEAGVLDATFGTGGVVYTAIPGGVGYDQGTGLGVQPDGKILVVGRSRRAPPETDAVVLRYLPSGALDPTFGTAGIAVVSFGADKRALGRRLSIQPDGKIVVTGTVFDPGTTIVGRAGLFRLNGDGTLDVGFGSAGLSVVPLGTDGGVVYSLVQQPDNRPVVIGWRDRAPVSGSDTIAIVMRYTAFGTLDTTWDGDGIYELSAPGFPQSIGSSIAIDDHDRIVVTGSVTSGTDTRWTVARLTTGPKMECKP
jgi:uncharacterized delta-60 repeat protein